MQIFLTFTACSLLRQLLANSRPIVVQRNPRLKRSDFPDPFAENFVVGGPATLHPWLSGFVKAQPPTPTGKLRNRTAAAKEPRPKWAADAWGGGGARVERVGSALANSHQAKGHGGLKMGAAGAATAIAARESFVGGGMGLVAAIVPQGGRVVGILPLLKVGRARSSSSDRRLAGVASNV